MRFSTALSLLTLAGVSYGCLPFFSDPTPKSYSSNYSDEHLSQSRTFNYTGLVHEEISELILFPTREVRDNKTLEYAVLSYSGSAISSSSDDKIFTTRECHELINRGIPLSKTDLEKFIGFIDALPKSTNPGSTVVQSAEFLAVNGWHELRLQVVDSPNRPQYQMRLNNTYQPINRQSDSTDSHLTSVVRQLLRATQSPVKNFFIKELEYEWLQNLRALLARSLEEIENLKPDPGVR